MICFSEFGPAHFSHSLSFVFPFLFSLVCSYASDLNNVIKVYLLPMQFLQLVTPEEKNAIFSNIERL